MADEPKPTRRYEFALEFFDGEYPRSELRYPEDITVEGIDYVIQCLEGVRKLKAK